MYRAAAFARPLDGPRWPRCETTGRGPRWRVARAAHRLLV